MEWEPGMWYTGKIENSLVGHTLVMQYLLHPVIVAIQNSKHMFQAIHTWQKIVHETNRIQQILQMISSSVISTPTTHSLAKVGIK